ncbi:UPF0136 domain [Micractinium conductrix]|uniref:UPF0136 domain n=1 Tax=Micractinium conductrix TaxID=554055 RepID=A0A2P6VH51_9CHLO|nr:UPF0136 domain [Micractinium conductrix]|eukprot:PSC73398.1 UPF0136 domain [Micractinium conductrix]
MSFVTGVGGLSAYWTRRSSLGLAAGLGVAATFGLGGWWIRSASPEKHEMAHQMCLISSVLFGGAMGYRAGSNPYVGPGGSMLAALGGVSSAYHLAKFLEWRAYEQHRITEAERLLRNYQAKHPDTAPHPAEAHELAQSHQQPGPFASHGRPHYERRRPVPPGGF